MPNGFTSGAGYGSAIPIPAPPSPELPPVYDQNGELIIGDDIVPDWLSDDEQEGYPLLRYMLSQLADWIVENIVRPGIEGAVWLINWIKAELRYWTYEAIKFLTEVTSTTEGLIVVLIGVIVAGIMIPELVAKIGSSSIGVFVGKLVDWIKEKTGNILELVGFVDILTVHEVLLTVWPKWREVFTPFQDAISGLAEVLGQGTGYIHAWLSVGHGLSMLGTSLLNLDPEIGELRAMEKSEQFMQRLDEKMRDYQHDPGLIARDIVENIYIPYAREIQNTQAGTIESIKDGRDHLLRIDQALIDVDQRIAHLIAVTPEDLQEQMEENFTGMREVLDNYSTWIESKVLPNISASIDALERRSGYLERANTIARLKLDNPIEIFMATEFQDEETQLATYEYLEKMVLAAEEEKAVEASKGADRIQSESIEITSKVIMETTAPPFLQLEAPVGKVPTPTPDSKLTGWNVGEY